MKNKQILESEHRLVSEAMAGSVDAWHQIIERYTGLIYGMISRYLATQDRDEQMTVYVDVLESLRNHALARFEGRASLSTWIGAVTRSRCMDHLRKNFGRHTAPSWLEDLSPSDQEVYRLFYLEGHGFAQICRDEDGNPGPFSVEQLIAALDRIDEQLDRSSRRRLAFDLEARSVTAASGRLLEYLAYSRQEAENSRDRSNSDLGVLEQDARRLLKKVQDALDQLDPEERDVIHWRYHEGLTADAVARQMKLTGARRVYTVSDRALRKLRLILEAPEIQ